MKSRHLAFLAILALSPLAESAAVARGPYLQNATPTSVVVRWRTDVATDSRVDFGTSAGSLTGSNTDAAAGTNHAVTLTGLTPGTVYYYSIGSSTATLASGDDCFFKTLPAPGTSAPMRVWVLGDSGTANSYAAMVRNAYAAFNGARHTDVWLMLGDNAYSSGTDAQYQAAVFNMYPAQLRHTLLWPTIGNHDTAQSQTQSPTTPYLDIFTLPTAGEAGGAPSGTERYYSFDFGGVHFICLDSMTNNRSPTGPMARWLEEDLESTLSRWIVAFWHHPPYTKGSHNSDTESQLVEMRENILPILEAGGVDLVLNGHSHCYERSVMLDGHYGPSTSLSPAMVLDASDGGAATGGYRKPVGTAGHRGAVYVVTGNGGQATYWTGGSTALVNPSPHPVMHASLLELGCLVLDVDGDRLDATFIRPDPSAAQYAIDDSFTILKDQPNIPPVIAIAEPAEGEEFALGVGVTLSANATDANGAVTKVEYFDGVSSLGVATTAPFIVTWNGAALGSHTLTAVATDNHGGNATSAAVTVNIITPPNPPPPPLSLAAASGMGFVALTWNASPDATSYRVKRALTSGGPYATLAAKVTGTSFVDAGLTTPGPFYYVVSAVHAGIEGSNSNEATGAPVTQNIVLAAGMSIDGVAPGAVYKTFSSPAINDAGQIAVLAAFTAPGLSVRGIVAGNPPTLVARTTGEAPGIPGATFSAFGEPMLNQMGEVAFNGRVTYPGVLSTNDEGIWTSAGGTLALAAREGDEPPGVPGGQWLRFTSAVFGDDVLAFVGTLATGPNGTANAAGVSALNNIGVWLRDDTGTHLVLREGDVITLSTGAKTVRSFVALAPGSYSRGHGYRGGFESVVSRVQFTDGTKAILALGTAGLTEIAAFNTDAPGYAPGAKFATFGTPTPAGDGTAFWAGLRSGTGNVVTSNATAVFSSAGGALSRRVVRGEPAAGFGAGPVFTSFYDPAGTADGRVAFIGATQGAPVTSLDNSGIWHRQANGGLSLVAREGGVAPGIGTAGNEGRFHAFISLALPGNAPPIFTARLRIGPGGVTTANDTGLWAQDSFGTVRLLLREGQELSGKAVQSYLVLNPVARTPAQTRSFNANGKIIARVTFTDRTQSLAIFDVP